MLHFLYFRNGSSNILSTKGSCIFEKKTNNSNENLTKEIINIEESEKELDAMIKALKNSPTPQQIEMMPLPPPPPSPAEAESSLRLLISSISPLSPLLSKDIKK